MAFPCSQFTFSWAIETLELCKLIPDDQHQHLILTGSAASRKNRGGGKERAKTPDLVFLAARLTFVARGALGDLLFGLFPRLRSVP